MTRVQTALEQIEAARQYTLRLVHDLEPDDWFRQPSEGVTHIAWQIGHLAMAQYRLALERLRGDRPADAALICPDFLQRFAKGSTPEPKAALYPAPAEIRQTLDRVYAQVLAEVPHYADGDLEQPPLKPHPLFTTKIGSLFWCARHEMLHAGQIGLVRRLLGKPPQW